MTRFFFDEINGSWHLIPAEKRDAWRLYKAEVKAMDDDEPEWVEGVVAVGHPSWFTFSDHHHGEGRDSQ